RERLAGVLRRAERARVARREVRLDGPRAGTHRAAVDRGDPGGGVHRSRAAVLRGRTVVTDEVHRAGRVRVDRRGEVLGVEGVPRTRVHGDGCRRRRGDTVDVEGQRRRGGVPEAGGSGEAGGDAVVAHAQCAGRERVVATTGRGARTQVVHTV